ncbi:hypothetical protein P43SY_009055 [Pythium insidiosum]|uniref:Pre-mRNA-splicing factor CWC26 n=1 Tax=Pythium insidiosum TaxID=114742 RepID=A0AAD5LRB3_PYTIN|nr:hypothetical protein P43SY_009055 [Pythium insidiosum]
MTSKLEYLQRYMSSGSDPTTAEKKLRKKVKKKKDSGNALRIVDEDDDWTQSAPTRTDLNHRWEVDAAEDEAPVVLADGEVVDPQDLPTIVNADDFKEELERQQQQKQSVRETDTPVRGLGLGLGRRAAVIADEVAAAVTPRDLARETIDADKITGVVKPHAGRSRPASEAIPTETARAPVEEKKTPATEEYKPRAGLFTPEEFAADLKKKAEHMDALRGAKAEDMGQNAETVYRDRKGRKLDMLNEMVRQQEILEGKRKREAQEAYEWGTGRVQKEERKSQQALLEEMKVAPFARHDDDEELERMRRERVRAFDPINSKVFQDDLLDDEGGKKRSKNKKKDKKKKVKGSRDAKPKYMGPPAPPNRFGIQPGYRWDGVVRGTGWEEKVMLRQNAQSATSEEAYKYAVADM